MLSFPRDLLVDIRCPGRASYLDKINPAFTTCGPKGAVETVKADRRSDQLHHHGQLPRLPHSSSTDRRHLGGRRPPLLQRLGARAATRRSTSSPGTSAERLPGSRLRPLSAHRLRRLPEGAPAAVRAGVQGPGASAFSSRKLPQVIKVITTNVEVGQGGGGTSPEDGALVRVPRLRATGRAISSSRRSTGSRSYYNLFVLAGEHAARRSPVPEPRRAVAGEGDGGRTRAEAQVEHAAATRDVRHGAERQRRRGLRDDARATSSAARLSDPHSDQRPHGERAQLRLLPVRRSTSTHARGAKAAAPSWRTCSARRTCEARAGDPRAREQRHARRRRRPDLPRPPGLPRRSTRRRSGSRRTSPWARRRPSSCSARHRAKIPFPLMVPTVLERSSWIDRTRRSASTGSTPTASTRRPARVPDRGERVLGRADDATGRTRPSCRERNFIRRIGGRRYELHYNGPKLHMVVLRTDGAVLGVNTLLDPLSNETMLAIAKGLSPLATVSGAST